VNLLHICLYGHIRIGLNVYNEVGRGSPYDCFVYIWRERAIGLRRKYEYVRAAIESVVIYVTRGYEWYYSVLFAQNSAVIINNINERILIGTQNCKPIETSELVYYIRYVYYILEHTYVRCNSRRIFDSLDEGVKYIGAKSVLICTVMPFFI
jgi:hypothetical protein